VTSRNVARLVRMLNRSQALVLVFFAVWIALVCILAIAPQVYVQALNVSPAVEISAEIGLLSFITALIAVMSSVLCVAGDGLSG
jgi:ABC-type uncharacterized transport system permease subunit